MQSSRLQDGSLVITPDGRMSNTGYHKYSKNTWWVRYNGEFLPLNKAGGLIVDGIGGPGGWRGDRSITITIPAAIIAEGGDITIGCGPDEKAGVRETKTFKSLAALQISQKKSKPMAAKDFKKTQKKLDARILGQLGGYAAKFDMLTGKAKRNMARYLLEEIRKADKAKTPEASGKALSKAVSSIGQNLTEAGYDEVAKELTAMAKETQAAREDYYKELGFDIEGADFERLAMLRKKAVNGVYNGKLSLSTDLKKALVKYEGGKLTHDQLVDKIQAGLGTAQARAYTIANTAVQSADRATSFILGEEIGVEFWQYSGVIIENTREFCKRLLTGRHPNTGEPHPNKYTAEEIAKMNNGQDLNVKENCGGYNCTHIWVPDMESVAKAQEQAPKEAAKPEPVKLETPQRIIVKDYNDGKTLATSVFKTLSELEQKSILGYTDGEDYKILNNALRYDNITPEDNEKINKLSESIKKLPAYKGTTYRGISGGWREIQDIIDEMEEGEAWGDAGYLSTTKDKSVAKGFTPAYRNTIIFTIKSKNGSIINGISSHPDEEEVLFDKGKMFIVKEIKHKEDKNNRTDAWTVLLEDLE